MGLLFPLSSNGLRIPWNLTFHSSEPITLPFCVVTLPLSELGRVDPTYKVSNCVMYGNGLYERYDHLSGLIQSGVSGHLLGFEDDDLGSSPGWWAATVATYCPSRLDRGSSPNSWLQVILRFINVSDPTKSRSYLHCGASTQPQSFLLLSFGRSDYQLGCTVDAVSAQWPVERVKNDLQNITTEWMPHSVHN